MRQIIFTPKHLRSILLFFMLLSHFLIAQTTPRLDSLLLAIKAMKEDTIKANALIEIAREYYLRLNDKQKAGKCGWELLALAQRLHYKKGVAYALSNIATSYRPSGNYNFVLYYDKKALQLMKEIGDKKEESSSYASIGLSYFKVGDYKKAIEYIEKGITIKETIGDKVGIADCYNDIGNVYKNQGNYPVSLKYHLKALKLREELYDKGGISMSYNNIGNVFNGQSRLDEALACYKKAAKIAEEINNKQGLGNAYGNIGEVYSQKKQFNEALTYQFMSLKIFNALQDKQGIGVVCYMIGTCYLNSKNTELALTYFLKCYPLLQQIDDKIGVADVLNGIGSIYEKEKRWNEALNYYTQMLKVSEEVGYKEGIANAYIHFASVYKQQKKFEKALAYTELYNAVKDSLLNKENFKQVAELNTRYETDKKEKEILLLTKDQDLNAKTIKQQQLVRWGLIGGLGLLSISIFSIFRRYRFKQKANVLLERQKEEIQQKNTLITDSIDYAKTIQEAVLPTTQEIKKLLPQSFVLYKPKAIVSGDFYWLNTINDQLTCAVADCTGHGVPGAFMSLLGYNMLEDVAKMLPASRPAFILNALNQQLITRLSGDDKEETIKHGMDISLISIDPATDVLEFAGAHNSLYIVRGTELIELKADKINIGGNKQDRSFTNQFIELNKGDMIYLFTDGFPDQIGGPNRKKFYYQPFKELLISISKLKPEEQKVKLDEAHTLWMGEKKDQTDDILIMGIRYS